MKKAQDRTHRSVDTKRVKPECTASASDSIGSALGLKQVWAWHEGIVLELGVHGVEVPPGRRVVIKWNEIADPVTVTGGIPDAGWDILKLALCASGRVRIQSDKPGFEWTTDFRMVSALRT
jgi:hypothetical protein